MKAGDTKSLGRNEVTFQCPHCEILSLHLLQEPVRNLQSYHETITLRDKGGRHIKQMFTLSTLSTGVLIVRKIHTFSFKMKRKYGQVG